MFPEIKGSEAKNGQPARMEGHSDEAKAPLGERLNFMSEKGCRQKVP
jgi:hypothetical protein